MNKKLVQTIKKEKLKVKTNKSKIDPAFRKEIETIIKEHQNEFGRLK